MLIYSGILLNVFFLPFFTVLITLFNVKLLNKVLSYFARYISAFLFIYVTKLIIRVSLIINVKLKSFLFRIINNLSVIRYINIF